MLHSRLHPHCIVSWLNCLSWGLVGYWDTQLMLAVLMIVRPMTADKLVWVVVVVVVIFILIRTSAQAWLPPRQLNQKPPPGGRRNKWVCV